MKFVASMPEQINTPTMHFSEVSRDPCLTTNDFAVQAEMVTVDSSIDMDLL